MKLLDFFEPGSVDLELSANSKNGILRELVELLDLDEESGGVLYKTIQRRENLGSTGIGKRIAIPHCRSLVVRKLRLAYGRKRGGLDFNSIDGEPVSHFLLIVAPPLELSSQYLPVLGKIAQFAKDPDITQKLAALTRPDEFLALLKERDI